MKFKKKNIFCKICKSKNLTLLTNEIRETKKDVLRCNKCGIVFLKDFKNIKYENKRSKYHSKIVNEKKSYKKMLIERSKNIKIVYKKFITYIKKDKLIDLLEIGPGLGAINYLLQKDLKKINYNFIEKNNFYKKKILSSFPKTKVLDDLDFNSKNLNYDTYSIILLVHVFEHIDDPIKLIKQIHLRLKKNGKVILFMPNYNDYLIENLNGEALKNYKKTIHHESHLFYYNKKSFKNLINKVKLFKIEKIETIEEYSILNFFNWIINKKPQINYTIATETTKNFKIFDKFFKSEVQKKGKGSTLFVVLKKL